MRQPKTVKSEAWPPWAWAICAFAIMAVAITSCGPGGRSTPSNDASYPASNPNRSASAESLHAMAAIINMNGELCAKVTSINPVGGDIYNVSCIRYRDGTGNATYRVDMKSGAVK